MHEPQPTSKITHLCPSGHRLSGGAELVGKTVKCPRCGAAFVFAPSAEAPPTSPSAPVNDDRRVTDTRVMRILGDHPSPPVSSEPAPPVNAEAKGFTDTGVMRILGDVSHLPPPPEERQETPTRPCPRCEVPIPETAAVCEHCNCYVGVMPRFMSNLSGENPSQRS